MPFLFQKAFILLSAIHVFAVSDTQNLNRLRIKILKQDAPFAIDSERKISSELAMKLFRVEKRMARVLRKKKNKAIKFLLKKIRQYADAF